MAITELLAVLSGLLEWEDYFVNKVVVMVMTDNQNILTWVRTKGARNLYAQSLLRLITRREVRGKDQVWAEDVRSEDNLLPDCLSRRLDRHGKLDTAEVQRWLEIQESMGVQVRINSPTNPFPDSWFESVEPHRWIMKLPRESLKDYQDWNPTQPRSVHNTSVPTVRVKLPRCGGGLLQGVALQSHLTLVEQAVAQVENAILASRTKAKYAKDFQAWVDYQDRTGSPHFLQEAAGNSGDLGSLKRFHQLSRRSERIETYNNCRIPICNPKSPYCTWLPRSDRTIEGPWYVKGPQEDAGPEGIQEAGNPRHAIACKSKLGFGIHPSHLSMGRTAYRLHVSPTSV